MTQVEPVDNNPNCKLHDGREKTMFCQEHLIWLCDMCYIQHKVCKRGGLLHYTEIVKLLETSNMKQTHSDLQKIANEITNCLARTKNEFINKIDDYQNCLSQSLNFNFDYSNKNQLQLAMHCFRYKQSNEEQEYDLFYQGLVSFIADLEKSKELFLNYKIIREQEGYINQNNIDLLRTWTEKPRLNVDLVYKASRDGFKAMEFHSKCENISPSIVIAKTQFGKLIGGYSEQPWNVATKDYVPKGDTNGKNFIFSLDMKEKIIPKDKKYSISLSTNSGPVFGCLYTKTYAPMISATFTPDFEIVSECNTKKCQFNHIGSNYVFHGTREEFFGGDSPFLIEDYELYRVL